MANYKHDYKMVSEIRQSRKGHFYLHVDILKDGESAEGMIPNKICDAWEKVLPLIECGNDYGYSESYEEALNRKEEVDNIILLALKNKSVNNNPNIYFDIKVSHVFSL